MNFIAQKNFLTMKYFQTTVTYFNLMVNATYIQLQGMAMGTK